MNVRVLIVDDQRMVRDGLELLIGLLPDIELVGTANDGVQAIALVAELQPDVVLMDLHMPRMDGTDATRHIRQTHPEVQVIVLTTYADDASVFGALRAGARGYLTKDTSSEQITHAIHTVAAGQALLDPTVQSRLLDHLDGPPPPSQPAAAGPPDNLSNRELEVLQLIANGLSNPEIATRLFVTEATVKTHINHVFSKTGVRDRAQAVRYAYQHGLAIP
jgi:DNA-binding NarL/FixJ family response regulator